MKHIGKMAIIGLLGLCCAAFAQQVRFDTWHQKHLDTAPKRVQTDGKSVFIFNPRTLRWHAYNRSGSLVASGHGSGGRDYCKDLQAPCRTPVGTFRVDGFGDAECLSMDIPGQGRVNMPYCMHVSGGFSIHGFHNVPNYNASHGCIRVKTSVAKWLQDNVIEPGTKVIVLPY